MRMVPAPEVRWLKAVLVLVVAGMCSVAVAMQRREDERRRRRTSQIER